MRNIDSVLLIALMLFMPLLMSATERGGLEFSFANTHVQKSGGDSYLCFDVMIRGNNPGDRLGTGIVLINYSSAVFGYRVKQQSNLIVSKGTLLSGNPTSYYNLYIADSLPTRIGLTYEYYMQPGSGSLVPAEFTQLINVKMKIQNINLPAGISFYSNGMSMQQYLDDNVTVFNPINTAATIAEIIPGSPDISSISQQNDHITITWQPFPNCNYNVFSAASPNSDIWINEAENISNNYWTGLQSPDKRFYIVTATSNVNNGSRRNEIGK